MKLLSPEEIGAVLGISRSSARRMLLENQLSTIILRSGKRKKIYRVREEALERWILSRERQAQRAPAG